MSTTSIKTKLQAINLGSRQHFMTESAKLNNKENSETLTDESCFISNHATPSEHVATNLPDTRPKIMLRAYDDQRTARDHKIERGYFKQGQEMQL